MDTASFHSKEGRLEESLRAAETLIANGDDLAVGKFIGLLKGGGGSGSGHLLLKVKGNIAKLLLDVTDNFTLSSCGERVATLGEDLHQVVCEFTTSKIKTDYGMGKSITFIDRHTMRDTVPRVHDDTSGTTRGIKREDSLDSNIHGWHVECFEHNLCHLFTVGLWVERCLSKEYRLFLRSNSKLIIEGVVPDLLHVIPVSDDTMFNRILQSEDTSLGLSLISNICILLTHANHYTLVTGTTNNGWKDSTRSIISSKASFAHTRSIVNNQSGNVFVTHLVFVLVRYLSS